ncbi:protein NRDE2 homolog [Orussus abietinus]|uniref:protein NRDE2 homolog n=1 Tax=Orussus abietinus TaxID=222816 RepID=UPI000625486F|nr:protein NRDE2 homolog [Orussus abietinus]
MSLFPAYSENDGTPQLSGSIPQKPEDKTNWLSNSSFGADVTLKKSTITISDSSSDEYLDADESQAQESYIAETLPPLVVHSEDKVIDSAKHVKRHKKESKKYRSSKSKCKTPLDVKNVFFEDRHRDRGNCTVDTLCSRVRPLYNVEKRHSACISRKHFLKDSFQRYHVKNLDAERLKKKDTVIKRESRKADTDNKEELPSFCVNLEEEYKKRTQEFNEKLTQNPNDITLWQQYVDFQDLFAKFQNHLVTRDNYVTSCQRKLSIVETALKKNPESTELFKLKLYLIGETLPADQFSMELEKLLNKDSQNMILWQTLIMTMQASVAICTVPKVLSYFSKYFCTLRQRAKVTSELDGRILDMMYRCLIFLRQTGLWEQMWEILRLNLCLNLNLDKEGLRFQGSIDERKLIGMEEVILTSRLPLNQLWLRVESLRESCHWISVSSEELELVGDSRRFVLPEDVADYVHPMISRNSNFRMAIYALLCLKVPLLPSRHMMFKDLGLAELNWSADSSEVLLPLTYPEIGEMAGYKQRKALLEGVFEGGLTSGPQYLRFHPAQEPFLDFLRNTFRSVAEGLPNIQRTSIYVWWLRFERLLVHLNKDDPLKSDSRDKKLKTILKDFLKKEENRNNLHFYREYALIEREMGRFDQCINILKTAIQLQNDNPGSVSNYEERAALFSIYRTLIETLLNTETYQESHKDRALEIFCQMIPQPNKSSLAEVEEYLFDNVQQFLQTPIPQFIEETYFLPNLECDLIMCYIYFLYVNQRNIYDILTIFKNCLEHSNECLHLQERLYEGEIALLQLYCEQNLRCRSIYRTVINCALNAYPDNFYILSAFAEMESSLPLWKINRTSNNKRLWKSIVTCLAGRVQINNLRNTGHLMKLNPAFNKLLSIHQRLAKARETQHCPLLWRLYMLLLREHNLCEKKGEEVYHESIANCPWARGIYTDAAEVAPQLLTQIQDIIREKELRMHVTPEELDILRG